MPKVHPIVYSDGKPASLPDLDQLRGWCDALGLAQIGLVPLGPGSADETATRQAALQSWLESGNHGEMAYMAREPKRRADPAELVPGTLSALVVALDYASGDPDWIERDWRRLRAPGAAYVSNYARGRDYHKLVRRRLQRLADRMQQALGPFGHRAFCDSAPVMEVALAERAGLGWRGKHTLLLDRRHGSMFFLGVLYTDLPLRPTAPVPAVTAHCGTCTRCIAACPTGAIVAPYRLDARRCISYLTIELAGSIPEALRPLVGNRIYGCDDCQLVCPWNGFASAGDPEFAARNGLDRAALVELFAWSEAEFLSRMQGSPIRRIGYERWLRNLATALGNLADTSAGPAIRQAAVAALQGRVDHPSALVREHVGWALERLSRPRSTAPGGDAIASSAGVSDASGGGIDGAAARATTAGAP